MNNLPRIQALIAPISAPIPSALGVAMEAYNYFVNASWFLAWIAAIGAFVGIETLGGASCYAVIKLHRERNYGAEFYIALGGIIAYVASGLYTLALSPIVIFFFLAPFSYFAYSILRSMDTEIQEKIIETETQVKLLDAQRQLVNAETRKTRAMSEGVRVGQTTGQVEPPKQTPRVRVYEYLSDNPAASVRGVAAELGLPKSTVESYVREWKSQK